MLNAGVVRIGKNNGFKTWIFKRTNSAIIIPSATLSLHELSLEFFNIKATRMAHIYPTQHISINKPA